MNEIRLAKKRYRDKINKHKKANRIDNKKHNKKNDKDRKIKEGYDKYNHQQLQKTMETTKLHKKSNTN